MRGIEIMNCDCKARTDEKLKEQNLKLVGYTFLMPDFDMVPQVETAWIDANKAPKGKKRTPPQMLASHCPFCGKSVKKKEAQ